MKGFNRGLGKEQAEVQDYILKVRKEQRLCLGQSKTIMVDEFVL